MNLPENGHPVFSIHQSKSVNAKARKILKEATREGIAKAVQKAFKRIHAKLLREANTFGHPVLSLDSLGLQMRSAVVPPLVVVFGVNRVAHVVFVADFQWVIPID